MTTAIHEENGELRVERGGVEVNVVVGEKYKIEPINPRKKKNRGRICKILNLPSEFMSTEALAKFEDTKRTGKVDIRELLPL
ncbi:hypothetical protein [Desulfogranum marinum]|uniref:hypothetical protein n=1 Tax=Desulfogranum marinum TaxID=453220 RepID=UPI0029C858E3|nr:hypothetical protein [Desulfogranum marinum]